MPRIVQALELRPLATIIRACWVCDGKPGPREQLAPLEWLTGWHLQPGESGIFFCGPCYMLVEADFRSIGLGPSGLAAMGR